MISCNKLLSYPRLSKLLRNSYSLYLPSRERKETLHVAPGADVFLTLPISLVGLAAGLTIQLASGCCPFSGDISCPIFLIVSSIHPTFYSVLIHEIVGSHFRPLGKETETFC